MTKNMKRLFVPIIFALCRADCDCNCNFVRNCNDDLEQRLYILESIVEDLQEKNIQLEQRNENLEKQLDQLEFVINRISR